MKKYNKKTIFDYVNGNDIEDFEITKLENDISFMTAVLDFTDDEKMYAFCSEELKQNFDFIKYVILKFKDNTSFISKVADDFLKNSNNHMQRIEVAVIMTQLLKKIDIRSKYEAICDSAYLQKRVEIEIYRSENKAITKDIGTGFLLIYDAFFESETIINYYAQKLIRDIIVENNIDVEKMLHSSFTSPEGIKKQGMNNYLLNFIKKYDAMLSDYLSTHIHLLDDIKKEMNEYLGKWQRYDAKKEMVQYTLMLDKVHEYLSSVDSIYSESYFLYYIGNKLGITNKIAKYDDISDELLEVIMRDINEGYFLGDEMPEKMYFHNVEKIMRQCLSNDEAALSDDERSKLIKINK